MFGIHDLWLFIVASLLLTVTPGPDMAFFGSRAASQGMRSGLVGTCTGCLVHTLAAAFGLSAILLASANAFLLVKLLGAAYLIYVGISMLRERAANGLALNEKLPATSHRKIYWQGFLTNVLNPKVALFYLAFLPQFISADSSNKTAAFLILGILFIVNSLFVTLRLVWFIASARERLSANAKIGLRLNRMCGALFVGVGIKLAFTERPA